MIHFISLVLHLIHLNNKILETGESIETAEHVLFDSQAPIRCRLQTMGCPGSELENIQRDPAGVVRGLIRGMCVLVDEAATDM